MIALDDLASEMDRQHQRRVLQHLVACGAQVFITGTEAPSALAELDVETTVFHVEHGELRPA